VGFLGGGGQLFFDFGLTDFSDFGHGGGIRRGEYKGECDSERVHGIPSGKAIKIPRNRLVVKHLGFFREEMMPLAEDERQPPCHQESDVDGYELGEVVGEGLFAVEKVGYLGDHPILEHDGRG
jgi:hypothetical protein